jgi:hypothetical protein
MVDVKSLDDVRTRVLDLLKIFLAASPRGERAVLVLETRSKALTTKYRSLDDAVIGVPVPSTQNTVKKKSPARARRLQLRLESFMEKKSEEKAKMEQQLMLDSQAAEVPSSTSNKLVLELAKQETRPVGTGLPSPILQVDGETGEETARYLFEISYHEDDIMYTLRDIFPPSEVKLSLESRVRIKPLDACHLCTVIATGRKLSWPKMSQVQATVIENVRAILK